MAVDPQDHQEISSELANAIAITIKDDDNTTNDNTNNKKYDSDAPSECSKTLTLVQKLMAEFMGTYLLLFTGFTGGVVNKQMNNVLTFPGVALMWGLDAMVMIYTVGHISGAHFNPAVTIAFATCDRFAWKHVPAYISVQMLASMLASESVLIMFGKDQIDFLGTIPEGPEGRSLVLEFIITFYLMFAVSGIATDHRGIGELGGLALGATVTINSLLAGPISGASMNPARSLGPAIASNYYKSIWVYILGPTAGAVCGAWFYNLIRSTEKPFNDIVKIKYFLRK